MGKGRENWIYSPFSLPFPPLTSLLCADLGVGVADVLVVSKPPPLVRVLSKFFPEFLSLIVHQGVLLIIFSRSSISPRPLLRSSPHSTASLSAASPSTYVSLAFSPRTRQPFLRAYQNDEQQQLKLGLSRSHSVSLCPYNWMEKRRRAELCCVEKIGAVAGARSTTWRRSSTRPPGRTSTRPPRRPSTRPSRRPRDRLQDHRGHQQQDHQGLPEELHQDRQQRRRLGQRPQVASDGWRGGGMGVFLSPSIARNLRSMSLPLALSTILTKLLPECLSKSLASCR